jgi:predicted Zn-dependent protease
MMKTTPLLLAALLGLTMPLALAPASPAQAATPAAAPTLPALGDAGGDELGLGAERRLGERIMKELRRDPDLLDDPLLQDYVDALWQPLLAAARARGDLPDEQREQFAWATFLVRDRSVNAFALPGGHVGVHLGLIAITSTRDELAAVLAHELSHVTQRHIARSIATSRRQSLIGAATMIAGILAASRSGDAANAMIVGGQAVAAQGQLNFSRDMEREADRIGFGVLEAAGFAPEGMAGMFDRLQSASRLNDSGQFPYLRSHPLTGERMAEARSRLGVNPAGSGAVPDAARWLHAAMQGRARALMDGRGETLSRLAGGGVPGAAAVAGTPEALSTACAAALAATRLKDWRAADAALARARTLAAGQGAPVQRAVQIIQIESMLDRGQTTEAARLLSGGLLDGSRAGLMLSARLAALPQAEATQAGRVREDLQTWVSVRPGDAGAWQALARVSERLGQPLASLRAQAEAQAALGDLAGAVDRLRAGQRLSRSSGAVESMEGVVIESRLKALEQQRRAELERERRGEDD